MYMRNISCTYIVHTYTYTYLLTYLLTIHTYCLYINSILTYLFTIHTYIRTVHTVHVVYTSIVSSFHHTLYYRRHVAAPVSGVSPPPWQIQWPVPFTAQPLLTLPLTSPPCRPFPSPHSGSSEGSYQAWMISSEWWPLHLHLHRHQQVTMTHIHTYIS